MINSKLQERWSHELSFIVPDFLLPLLLRYISTGDSLDRLASFACLSSWTSHSFLTCKQLEQFFPYLSITLLNSDEPDEEIRDFFSAINEKEKENESSDVASALLHMLLRHSKLQHYDSIIHLLIGSTRSALEGITYLQQNETCETLCVYLSNALQVLLELLKPVIDNRWYYIFKTYFILSFICCFINNIPF